MFLRPLMIFACLCLAIPLQAQTETELKSIVSIQQAQIKALQTELQNIKKPVVIKASLAGRLPTCGAVCESNKMVCLDGRLSKIKAPTILLEPQPQTLGCAAGSSGKEAIRATCICMEVEGV